MGQLRQMQNKLDEAAPLLREHVELCREVYGERHPYTHVATRNLDHFFVLEERELSAADAADAADETNNGRVALLAHVDPWSAH